MTPVQWSKGYRKTHREDTAGRLMLTRLGRLRTTQQATKVEGFTRSLLSTLEDDSNVERFRLILQPTIDSKLERVTTAMQQAVHDLEQAVGALQATVARKDGEILGLRREVLDLRKQHSIHASVRVFGVPGSTPHAMDNKLLDLRNQRMKIQPSITLDDIKVFHYVGRLMTTEPQPGQPTTVKPRPSIVKFLSRRTKQRVMAEQKSLRKFHAGGDADATGEGNEGGDDDDMEGTSCDEATLYPLPVYISDDLTRSRDKVAYKARELKRKDHICDAV